MKKLIISICCIVFVQKLFCIPQYYCTASDAKYFPHLVQLIGSIHYSNYNDLGEILVFDLGMPAQQIAFLKTIEKVSIRSVELVHPNLLKPVFAGTKFVPGWYAWKPVVIKQTLDIHPYCLWVDAGTTIFKPLNHLFEYINQTGYFLCTIGDET
jgi:hypothetical protein